MAEQCELDLVIGGSPCQDLSRMAGPERKGLKGPSSSLFWEFVRVLDIVRKKRPSVVFVLVRRLLFVGLQPLLRHDMLARTFFTRALGHAGPTIR